jgi:hypothetical protein
MVERYIQFSLALTPLPLVAPLALEMDRPEENLQDFNGEFLLQTFSIFSETGNFTDTSHNFFWKCVTFGFAVWNVRTLLFQKTFFPLQSGVTNRSDAVNFFLQTTDGKSNPPQSKSRREIQNRKIPMAECFRCNRGIGQLTADQIRCNIECQSVVMLERL